MLFINESSTVNIQNTVNTFQLKLILTVFVCITIIVIIIFIHGRQFKLGEIDNLLDSCIKEMHALYSDNITISHKVEEILLPYKITNIKKFYLLYKIYGHQIDDLIKNLPNYSIQEIKLHFPKDLEYDLNTVQKILKVKICTVIEGYNSILKLKNGDYAQNCYFVGEIESALGNFPRARINNTQLSKND